MILRARRPWKQRRACISYIKKEICDIITLYKIARFVVNGQREVSPGLQIRSAFKNIYVIDHCVQYHVSIYLHNYYKIMQLLPFNITMNKFKNVFTLHFKMTSYNIFLCCRLRNKMQIIYIFTVQHSLQSNLI